jgi:hypothetical protein
LNQKRRQSKMISDTVVDQTQLRKLVFQSQAQFRGLRSHSGQSKRFWRDSGVLRWASKLCEKGVNQLRPKTRQNILKHGSKVAVHFRRCLITKHLRNKTLAFESSASANSATPAFRKERDDTASAQNLK